MGEAKLGGEVFIVLILVGILAGLVCTTHMLSSSFAGWRRWLFAILVFCMVAVLPLLAFVGLGYLVSYSSPMPDVHGSSNKIQNTFS